MDTKINMLDKNTMENFKSISDDIYYINEKQNQENSQSLNPSESESDSESKFASFIN